MLLYQKPSRDSKVELKRELRKIGKELPAKDITYLANFIESKRCTDTACIINPASWMGIMEGAYDHTMHRYGRVLALDPYAGDCFLNPPLKAHDYFCEFKGWTKSTKTRFWMHQLVFVGGKTNPGLYFTAMVREELNKVSGNIDRILPRSAMDASVFLISQSHGSGVGQGTVFNSLYPPIFVFQRLAPANEQTTEAKPNAFAQTSTFTFVISTPLCQQPTEVIVKTSIKARMLEYTF